MAGDTALLEQGIIPWAAEHRVENFHAAKKNPPSIHSQR
jgi:hypothetical protein